MFSLEPYLSQSRDLVNQSLMQSFRDARPGAENLYRSVRYSLEAGGKRIRPILALATAQALHQNQNIVLPLACALEMIHTYSLIHDDLPAMDNDDLRRGKPTNHKAFGEACAILAGDALLTKAFEVLAASENMTLAVIREVAQAAGLEGMVGGQLMDLEAEDRQISLDEIERIHRHKTGALLRCSVTASARLCGANPEKLERLDQYGRAIGLAFQIADDILDLEGGAEIGKDIGSDLNKDKATYPKILGLEASKKMAKDLVDQAVKALGSFDEAALPLRELARYIVIRSK